MDGKEVQPIEHGNLRILTTAQLAAFYETTERRISENFNRNKARYVAGKHYFCLEGDELKAFGDSYAESVSVERVPKLYLWTEKGALLHAKSLNTDKAWERYEKLVDDYYRKVVESQPLVEPQTQLILNTAWSERLVLYYQQTTPPPDTWNVFEEVANFCHSDEFRGVRLLESATPDVSVGIRWVQHIREQGYDMSLIQKYDHLYPDKRGKQQANAYPNAWLGVFRSWFRGVYLKDNYPTYLKSRLASDEPLRLRTPGKDNNRTA